MPTVVGVRLRFSKTLWFDPAGSEPVEGDTVIVTTDRGTELGRVVQPPHEVAESDLPAPLKPVTRVATAEDLAVIAGLEEKEREAMPVFRQLVLDHKLDMKPIDVEYLFDGDKVVFYFSAEERVDFRELVKELAARFHARIDMRQIGVRDEARMVGGVGHCGQMLCCVRFGGEFQPVSIRMAKEQDLPLNPLKISGLCGRLMCCLRYEFDAYKDYKSRAPKRGAMVETPSGSAKVTDLNTPKETVTLRLEDGTNVTLPLSVMGCSKGSGCPCSVSKEALDDAMAPSPMAVALAESIGSKAAAQLTEIAEDKPAASAPAPAEGGGRRRRRRGGGGKAEGESGGGQQPKAQQPKAAGGKSDAAKGEAAKGRVPRRRSQQSAQPADGQPQPAAESGPKAEQAEGDKPARSGRRRRRRRSGGGGNKES